MDDTARVLGASLDDHECVLAVARAQLPVGWRQLLVRWAGWVVAASDFLLGRRPLDEVRPGSVAGFPPHVDLVATDSRILLLEARRMKAAPRLCVAQIPRDDISAVSLPFVGGGRWKTLRIERTSGPSVNLQIDRHRALGFVEALA